MGGRVLGIFHFLKILFTLPLLFFIPGYLTYVLFAREREGCPRDFLEVAFIQVLISVVLSSFCALVLAELGHFSLMKLVVLVAGYSIGLILRYRSKLIFSDGWKSFRWDYSQTLVVGMLLIAGVLFFQPFENILGGRDAGVYVNTGINIGRTGSILIRDDFFAKLRLETQEEFLWVFPGTEEARIKFRFPGFYWVRDRGLVIPQFLHLYPVWIAIFYSIFGLRGCLFATPFFGWLAALGVYLVGKALFSRAVGIIALSLLIVNPSQIWFSRYANSEILFQLLFIGGLFCWALFVRRNDRFWGAISGVCFGELFLTRIEAMYIFFPFLLLFGYLYAVREIKREFIYFAIPLGALLGLAAIHAYLFSFPYFLMLCHLMAPLTFNSGIILPILIILPISAVILAFRGIESIKNLLTTRRQVTLLTVVIGIAVLSFYMYFIRPNQPEVLQMPDGETVKTYDETNLVELGWYLSPLGLLLAIMGLSQVILTELNRKTIILVTSVLIYSAIYLKSGMISPDHIFATRRYITVIIPSAALLIGHAVTRLKCDNWGIWPQRILPCALTLALLASSAQTDLLIIRHREFEGAIAQVRQLAEALPEGAVVTFDGSSVGNFLAPPLTFIYDKKAMAFWPKEGEGPFGLESAERVFAEGFSEGREVFFVSTHEAPPSSPAYDLYSIRATTLEVPQLEHAFDHFPREVERWKLPYRIYRVQLGSGVIGYEGASLLNQVGEVVGDKDASRGEALYADVADDSEGYLCYGPYILFRAGGYQVCFRLKVNNDRVGKTVVATIDVAADIGETVLASKDVVSDDFGEICKYGDFCLDFDNPSMQALEFRVYFTDIADLWVDNIRVIP